MAKRTRIFLLASAGVLTAVLATALVAWAGGAAIGSNTPDEIAYVPGDAQMVAYADVRQVMSSPFRDRFRQFETSPASPDGLEARTGIQFDKDVDAVLIASSGTSQLPAPPDRALIIARGRFDAVRIEALMRDRGARIEQYRGKRLVIVKDEKNDAALTFAEPGLVLFGPGDGVR